jgi:glycosyltransferase involved in cell wall biosynthesis
MVSVIIPVYNGERYLAEAIESVLAQTYQPIELIVIDDGSTDGSAQVVKRFSPPVQYFYQPNSGLGAARNSGAVFAQGDYFAFLDADDVWMEHKLALQMAIFQSNPEADIVFGHVEQFISPELNEEQKSTIDCPAGTMPGYIAGAMVIKRESFVQAGPFETNWQIGEFIQWYIKAEEQRLKSVMLSDVVSRRRLHTDNMTIRARNARTDYVRILKASLDRRRASGRIKDIP